MASICILDTVKNSLGIQLDYKGYDADILIGINTALMSLNQLGIGPAEGFIVDGTDDFWESIIGSVKNLEAVKSLVCLKVRLLFDPPSSSFVLESINKTITELEWRLTVQADPPPVPEVPVDPEL